MRHRKAWLIIASILTVTGVLLLAVSVPIHMSRVTVHEEVFFEDHTTKIGPYDLESGDYSIWVEGAIPAIPDGDYYEAIIIDKDGEHEYNKFNEAMWQTIDGVDCRHITTFNDVGEGEHRFQLFSTANNTTEPLQVFVMMENTGPSFIMLIIGIVCTSLGSIILAVLVMRIRDRDRDDPGNS